ncbi:exopolysaccharide biosynthesis polyprenyl glycosylphosphotransferase [Actinopolyspora sp. BKK1]|nr:exopolysaccharide biosynthesis polyprenyl glycosylphosphotransferase [Actinopolyspora sp. BKK2]NHE76065.1 exopolysaccharide biosynthesis polyprenyl glycosylphosphotransferase [Actinopolyspora sp. BKK1]
MSWQLVPRQGGGEEPLRADRAAELGDVGRTSRAVRSAGSSLPGSSLPGNWVRLLPGRLLPCADVVALCAVLVLLRVGALAALSYSCGVLAILAARGAHRLRLCRRASDDVGSALVATGLPLLAFLPWSSARRVLLVGTCAAGALVCARVTTAVVLRSLHSWAGLSEQVLIVGRSEPAGALAEALGERPELGLRFVGFLDRTEEGRSDPEVLGEPAELAAFVRRYRVTRVVLCPSGESTAEVTDVVRRCRALPVDFCVVPRVPELGLGVPRATLDEVWGIPLVPIRRCPHTAVARAGKRVFDCLLASVLLVLVAPLLAALAAAVRWSSGGTALFRQERVTRGGALVRVTKLRTVAAGGGEQLAWKPAPEQCGRLAGWLRRSHLDELPQLLDVLRGGMSLVGPRPERPYYAVRFAETIPHYADRHRVRGGITGWAQVHGLHGDTSITERARFDNHYVEYWSPWMDLVVLVRTAGAVLAGFRRAGSNYEEGSSASTTRDYRVESRRCRAAVVRAGAAQQTRVRGGGAVQRG